MPSVFRFAALVLAVASGGCPALGQIRDYRLSHQFASDIDARDRAAKVFTEEVKKRLENITFSIFADSKLKIPPIEHLDALRDGRIELAIYPLFYGSKAIPEFSIGLLPGIPPDVGSANRLRGSEFAHRLQSIAEDRGVHILGWWWLAGGMVSRTGEIAGPATLKGRRARGGDAGFDAMLGAAGAEVVTIPSTEIAARMRDKTLDVTMTSLESLVSFRLFETAETAVIGGYGLWTSFQPLLMSKTAWDRLTEVEQEAFTQAAAISDAYFEASQNEAERSAIEAFSRAGVRVRPMSFDDYASWLRLAKDSSWQRFRNSGAGASELLSIMMQSLVESEPKDAGKRPQR